MSPPHHQVGEDADPKDGADERHGEESPGRLKRKAKKMEAQLFYLCFYTQPQLFRGNKYAEFAILKHFCSCCKSKKFYLDIWK